MWLGLLAMPAVAGCAVHYYDAAHKVDHVWGFAHVRVRHSGSNGLAATHTAVQTAGVAASFGRPGPGLMFGYNSSVWGEVQPDASLILDWKSGSLLSLDLLTNRPSFPSPNQSNQHAPQ